MKSRVLNILLSDKEKFSSGLHSQNSLWDKFVILNKNVLILMFHLESRIELHLSSLSSITSSVLHPLLCFLQCVLTLLFLPFSMSSNSSRNETQRWQLTPSSAHLQLAGSSSEMMVFKTSFSLSACRNETLFVCIGAPAARGEEPEA